MDSCSLLMLAVLVFVNYGMVIEEILIGVIVEVFFIERVHDYVVEVQSE